mmetsp:Transcript_16438/g.57445  ORF Transcript_16438/g.57445 Transcript_16438/m.57445 type:complete len:201 (-) Transcript_16438:1503-2105(-)
MEDRRRQPRLRRPARGQEARPVPQRDRPRDDAGGGVRRRRPRRPHRRRVVRTRLHALRVRPDRVGQDAHAVRPAGMHDGGESARGGRGHRAGGLGHVPSRGRAAAGGTGTERRPRVRVGRRGRRGRRRRAHDVRCGVGLADDWRLGGGGGGPQRPALHQGRPGARDELRVPRGGAQRVGRGDERDERDDDDVDPRGAGCR